MAELYDMETGVQVTAQGKRIPEKDMVMYDEMWKPDPKRRAFVACCGAELLCGFYPDAGTGNPYVAGGAVPPKFTLPVGDKFTLAVTNPEQERKWPQMVEALEKAGFERVGKFRGLHGYDLTLWGGGKVKLQPMLGDGEAARQVAGMKKELDAAHKETQKLTLREQKLQEELGEMRVKLSLRRSLRKKATTGPVRVNKVRAKRLSGAA